MNDTPTPRTDEWETYCDEWYYHMWRLRRKTERGWHDGFHIQKGDEAKGLCDILNNLEAELTAVTEQRDKFKSIAETAINDHEMSEIRNHKLTEQRDRLAEALIKCREDSVCEQVRMEKCRYTKAADESQANIDRADKALQYLTPDQP